jgi:hypothetical protein
MSKHLKFLLLLLCLLTVFLAIIAFFPMVLLSFFSLLALGVSYKIIMLLKQRTGKRR